MVASLALGHIIKVIWFFLMILNSIIDNTISLEDYNPDDFYCSVYLGIEDFTFLIFTLVITYFFGTYIYKAATFLTNLIFS